MSSIKNLNPSLSFLVLFFPVSLILGPAIYELNALLLIIGKIVKRICEYGKINFVYMKIENEFFIELSLNEEIQSKLKVEVN